MTPEGIEELRAERDDARSTLAAWFDVATKTVEQVTPILIAGLRGYLRTSKVGGMSDELANAVEAVLEDYCRLYVGRELVPVLRGIAAAEKAKLER